MALKNKGVKINNVQIISNEEIKFPKLRVSDSNGESLGILSKGDALDIAKEQGLDLILVTERADPPVCKITDAGKHRYEIQRQEKERKKKQAEARVDVKEIRFRPVTGIHDLETKAKQAKEFLEKGNHVKVTIRFRGREMANPAQGHTILDSFLDMLGDIQYIKRKAFAGRMLSAIIAKGD